MSFSTFASSGSAPWQALRRLLTDNEVVNSPAPAAQLEGLEPRMLMTTEAPYLVKDINTNGVGSPSNPTSPVNLNGVLYFGADNGVSGSELWKSDGTAAGTVLLKDIDVGPTGSGPRDLTVVGNTIFFTAYDPDFGTELYRSSGPAGGAVRVRDIVVGPDSGAPTGLTAVGNEVFFAANDGSTGIELWKSNGTTVGTVRVKDITPGTVGSYPVNFVNVNGTLFFGASDTAGSELWKSDGTAAGTVRVKDINPGDPSGSVSNLTNVNGVVFFTANDGASGIELWKSDGTTAGTVRVKDSVVGPGGLDVAPQFYNVNGRLFFTANDSNNGFELWTSDGTAAGTMMVANLTSGDANPTSLTQVGNRLFFAATTQSFSTELWAINLRPEIAVLDGATNVADNVGSVSFGSTPKGTPLTKTFTIRNLGTNTLSLGTPVVPPGFSLVTFPATTVAVGGSTTFTVRFLAPNIGTFGGQVSFVNNDTDENPFNFNITATATGAATDVRIVDDGDAGFSTTAGWTPSTTGRGNDVRYAPVGTGGSVATWNFSGVANGLYRVSTTWPASANRSSNAPYRIRATAGGPDLATASVNQRVAPVGFTDQGSSWSSLGVVSISGGQLVVQLSNSTTTGFVIADAVRIERVSSFIIDDGQPGFSTTGSWVGSLAGRDGDVRYSLPGTGANVASWTFTGLAPGQYTLAATWPPSSNRSNNAPYRIRETAGGANLLSVTANQRLAPASFSADGSAWQSLGTVTITGNQVVVQLTNATSTGIVIADAIRLVPVAAAPASPPIVAPTTTVAPPSTAARAPLSLAPQTIRFLNVAAETPVVAAPTLQPGDFAAFYQDADVVDAVLNDN